MRTGLAWRGAFIVTVAAVCGAEGNWLEGFETGSKTSYEAGDVTCDMGSWHMNDALIGNLANDKTIGADAVRIRGSGSIRMNFDKTGGAGVLSFYVAKYGTDADATATALAGMSITCCTKPACAFRATSRSSAPATYPSPGNWIPR